jgi:hypothetical protein
MIAVKDFIKSPLTLSLSLRGEGADKRLSFIYSERGVLRASFSN